MGFVGFCGRHALRRHSLSGLCAEVSKRYVFRGTIWKAWFAVFLLACTTISGVSYSSIKTPVVIVAWRQLSVHRCHNTPASNTGFWPCGIQSRRPPGNRPVLCSAVKRNTLESFTCIVFCKHWTCFQGVRIKYLAFVGFLREAISHLLNMFKVLLSSAAKDPVITSRQRR